jgi:hypothetical protein
MAAANFPDDKDPRRGFSFSNAVAVTPDNTTLLTYLAEALYVGVTGDVTLLTASGQTVLFKAVPAGQYIWTRTARVNSTATTATNILALY